MRCLLFSASARIAYSDSLRARSPSPRNVNIALALNDQLYPLVVQCTIIDYLEKGKTINSDYYMALLDRLSEEIKKKTSSHVKEKNVMVKLNELSFELLPHPLYSPDLPASGYWFFADLKNMLQGKRFYKEVIEKLEKRCNECITLEGNYVDK